MFVETLILGGLTYAGARTYWKHRQRRTPAWVFEGGRYIETNGTVIEQIDLDAIERRVNLNLNLAVFSLGLTVVGVWYEPLMLVALPFNIYDTIMIFEDMWAVILTGGRAVMIIVSSLLISFTLITHMQLLASFLQWLYFLNQKLVLLFMRSNLGQAILQQWQARPAAAGV